MNHFLTSSSWPYHPFIRDKAAESKVIQAAIYQMKRVPDAIRPELRCMGERRSAGETGRGPAYIVCTCSAQADRFCILGSLRLPSEEDVIHGHNAEIVYASKR